MAACKRFRPTWLSMLAGVIAFGGSVSEQTRGQEVLPTLRKTARATTVWVGDDGLQSGPVAIPKSMVATPQKAVAVPQKTVALPQNNSERHFAQSTNASSVANVRAGVVAVSDDQPVVTDRRAATLQALADGFRIPRVEADAAADVTEAAIPVTVSSLPAAYAAPVNEEPVTLLAPAREIPTPVAMPTRPTSPAAVEANMPATLERLPPVSSEMSEPPMQPQTRFVATEESPPRAELWPTRMITNPLRRAADNFSHRRNPLRSVD